MQTDLLFRFWRAGNRELDDGHPGYRGGCSLSRLYPRRRPDWILSAGSLRYVRVYIGKYNAATCKSGNKSLDGVGVALNNAFCFKHTPSGPRQTHPESNPFESSVSDFRCWFYLSDTEESRIPSSSKIGMVILIFWRRDNIEYGRNYFYFNRYRCWYRGETLTLIYVDFYKIYKIIINARSNPKNYHYLVDS